MSARSNRRWRITAAIDPSSNSSRSSVEPAAAATSLSVISSATRSWRSWLASSERRKARSVAPCAARRAFERPRAAPPYRTRPAGSSAASTTASESQAGPAGHEIDEDDGRADDPERDGAPIQRSRVRLSRRSPTPDRRFVDGGLIQGRRGEGRDRAEQSQVGGVELGRLARDRADHADPLAPDPSGAATSDANCRSASVARGSAAMSFTISGSPARIAPRMPLPGR